MKQARRFSPWREDFAVAGVLALIAAFALWRAVTAGTLGGFLIGSAFAALMLVAARNAWRNGHRRWYGHDLERWAVERLGRRLDRKKIPWRAGELVPGIGDADLLVETKSGLVVVEIKAIQRWSQSVFGGRGEREQAALEQAARLRDRLGADRAYVWLPRGHPTLFQRLFGAGGEGVRTIFGDERAILRRVRN